MHAEFAQRRTDEGFRLQQLLLPIEEFRARDGDSYGISMLKHALEGRQSEADELFRQVVRVPAEVGVRIDEHGC